MASQDQQQTPESDVLNDPSAVAVARVYANALLDAAAGAADAVLGEFASFLADVLAPNPKFRALLVSGATNADEKLGLIERAIASVCSPQFANFLRTLTEHDRMELLDTVFQQAQLLSEERAGRKRVQVTTAAGLSDNEIGRIRTQLDACFPFESIIETDVDPALIGGLVVQIENTVYDSSLRTRLDQLRDRMRERSLHEIQSGRDRFSHPEGD